MIELPTGLALPGILSRGAVVGPWMFPGAALDLDFAGGRGFPYSLDESIDVTRSSSGDYVQNSAGVWTPVAANTLRRSDRGALVEDVRINSIRNSAGLGAVAGTPGTNPDDWSISNTAAGLTKSIVGTQTIDGVEYVGVRFAGTASSTAYAIGFEANTQIAASVGQTYLEGVFASLVVNSGEVPAVAIRISERDSGGASLASNDGSALAINSTPQQFSLAATLGQATVAYVLPMLKLTFVAATAYDFTVWLGWPQLKLGSVLDSPIRTTTAAAQRAADVVSAPLAGGSSCALFVEFVVPEATGTGRYLLNWDDGTSNNRIYAYMNTGDNFQFGVIAAGGAEFSKNTAATPGSVVKAFAHVKGNYGIAAVNGTLIGSPDTALTMPSSLSTLRIGSRAGDLQPNTYIRRVAAWIGVDFTEAQAQALTS